MKKNKILFWIAFALTLAVDIFIIVNAFLNGEKSAAESNNFAHTTADVINTVKPETITPQNFDSFAFSLRKLVGHFGIFVVSGIFATLATSLAFFEVKNHKKLFIILVSFGHGLLLAFCSEFIQKFVADRSGNLIDVSIDFSGYILGFLLMILILFICTKKSKNKIRN